MDSRSKSDEKVREGAERLAAQLQKRRERRREGASDEVWERIEAYEHELRLAISEHDVKRMEELSSTIDDYIDEELGPPTKSTWREYVESIALAIVFAFVLRGFVVEAFKIPTGSMIPTLLIGDHLFVNKFVYGIRVPFTNTFVAHFQEPKPGDVVVFTFPREEAKAHIEKQPAPLRACIDRGSLEEEKDFIKRIVAVAGDTVEVREQVLFINGEPLKRTFHRKEKTDDFLNKYTVQEYEELGDHKYVVQYMSNGKSRNFGPVRVDPGNVFVMGDNRDNSSDSRCWGQVPTDNIKGRAMIIWWSIGPDELRWERIGRLID